jgi:hypothetical protein
MNADRKSTALRQVESIGAGTLRDFALPFSHLLIGKVVEGNQEK